MPPETLLTLGEHLTARGWTTADIHADSLPYCSRCLKGLA